MNKNKKSNKELELEILNKKMRDSMIEWGKKYERRAWLPKKLGLERQMFYLIRPNAYLDGKPFKVQWGFSKSKRRSHKRSHKRRSRRRSRRSRRSKR